MVQRRYAESPYCQRGAANISAAPLAPREAANAPAQQAGGSFQGERVHYVSVSQSLADAAEELTFAFSERAEKSLAKRRLSDAHARLSEVQAMLQHHHIGGVLPQGPGLFLTDDLHAWHRRAKTHVVLDLPRFGRAFGAGAVAHQIAPEKARQLLFQQAPLLLQQQLPERAGKPVARLADEF